MEVIIKHESFILSTDEELIKYREGAVKFFNDFGFKHEVRDGNIFWNENQRLVTNFEEIFESPQHTVELCEKYGFSVSVQKERDDYVVMISFNEIR